MGLGWDAIAGAATNGPGRNGVTKATPKKGGSLTFGVDAEEQGFDPTQARFDEVGVMYARTVFDPLTIVLANGDWAPYLAQSVVPNSSYTAWTITLRPNLVFHDGTPCNGAAMVTNLEAHAKSLLTGVVIGPTLHVDHPDRALSRPPSPSNRRGRPSPTTWLAASAARSPTSWRPSMLSNPNGTSHPVGTGPFVFKEWVPNDHFTATANPHYWRAGMPYLSQITYKPIPDEEARAEALKSGTIDLMVTDTPQIITQFRGNRSYSYIDDSTHVAGEPDMNCTQLNCLAPPFNNPSLRRAAAMAVNRNQYAKVIDEGVLAVSNGLFVTGSPYYSPTSYPAYNPSEASKLVRQAAKTNGGPISFTFGYDERPGRHPVRRSTSSRPGRPWASRSRTTIVRAERADQQRPRRQVPGAWAGGSSGPSTRTSITSSGARRRSARVRCRSTWPATPTRRSSRRCCRVARAPQPSTRAAAYKTVNKRLAARPPLPVARTGRSGRSSAIPTVQNFNNPTTPQGQSAFGMIGGSIWPTQIWIS